MMRRLSFAIALAVTCFGGMPTASADEGLWLFNEPPRDAVKKSYGFELSKSRLEHLQRSALRLNSGSGAFVSPDGLVLTNHHVVSTWLDLLSTKQRDVYQEGYYARTRAQELPCPGLHVGAVWKISDVTARVLGAIKPDMTLAESRHARKQIAAAIEEEWREKTGLFVEVVCIDSGARYHVYGYRKYTDVRLVFAPEAGMSRVFDVCVLRAYENGKPARVKHYLRWATGEPKADDLVLAAGFPGSTSRFLTVPHLEAMFGSSYLLSLKAQGRSEAVVSEFYKRNRDKEQEVRLEYYDTSKYLARSLQFLGGLEQTLARRREQENRSCESLDPYRYALYQAAQAQMAAAIKERERLYPRYFFLVSHGAFESQMFDLAREIVLLADEQEKPNAERLSEYTDAYLPTIKAALLIRKPIVKELETAKLADSLSFYAQWFGPDDPGVKTVLAGKSPEERARALVAGSNMDRVEARKALVEGGNKAVAASPDSMIALARLVDRPARKLREEYAEKVSERNLRAYALLARVQAKAAGYPDAGHSLRLSFGRVQVPRKHRDSVDTVGDMYRYLTSTNQLSFLPPRWQAARSLLSDSTPLTLTHGADVVAGNSGSPMVNRAGELVGVATYVTDYAILLFDPANAGNGAMSARGILTVLDKVYTAEELVKELGGSPATLNIASVPAPPIAPPPVVTDAPAPAASGVPTAPPTPAQRHKELIPGLIAALKDPDRAVVLSASAALSRIGAEAVPPLLELLQAKEPGFRAAAALALGRMAYRGESAIPALLTALTDKEIKVRRQAVAALTEIVHPNSYDFFPAAYSEPIPSTLPVPATEPLPSTATPAAPSTPPSQGLPAPSGSGLMPATWSAATSAKLSQRYKNLVPGLVAALKDPDHEMVQGAALALARLDDGAMPSLLDLLKSKQAKSRAAAALALGKMGYRGEAAIPGLLTALADDDIEVRRQAVRALPEVLPPPFATPSRPEQSHLTRRYKRLVPGLLTALEDSDRDLAQGAAVALGRIGPDAIPPLRVLLKATESKSRMRAALALGKVTYGRESAIPALLAALTDEDPNVRRQVAGALAEIIPDSSLVPAPYAAN